MSVQLDAELQVPNGVCGFSCGACDLLSWKHAVIEISSVSQSLAFLKGLQGDRRVMSEGHDGPHLLELCFVQASSPPSPPPPSLV